MAEKTVEKVKNAGLSTYEQYAIIQTGGKQYQAVPGKTVAIEKIDGEAGTKITFNDVLFRKQGDGKFEFGKPYLTKAVTASIVKQMRGPKVIAFRFKRRHKVRVKRGHRQAITVIRIEAI